MIRALVASSLVGLFVLAASTSASADGEANVACRTHSNNGTMELALKWDGSNAKGTLLQTAPSGNVTTTQVKAERADGLIVADDVFSSDLATHAAVIKVASGKKYMRTDSSWLACE
jgi:hypothetical protein